MDYCLAIDIGASSGRHILGHIEGGEIKTQEIYRFENGFENVDGTFSWNVEALMNSIVEGIKKCNDVGIIPKSIAIDTWGVDYVLLDENEKEILPAVAYRDDRTVGVPEKVDEIISREALYAKTGIQRANYNTIYQLYCDVQSGKIQKAAHLLMMPAYLSYRLTGVIKNEYTIASTSSLVNAETRDWDVEIIKSLGINPAIFAPICPPGSFVGNLKDEIKDYVGFDAKVVFAPAHDTASAVAACTFSNHGVFISSGTWSLVGAENKYPVLTKEAMEANFANEGGVNNTYRFLKNIMGMWLFQNIRKNLDKKYTYDEMMFMAMESSYKKTFDPNDERLVAPENMIEAVRDCLGEKDLPIADVLASVYHSLAASYKKVVDEIERVTGEAVDGINIVGGGCQDKYLNQLTGEYTGKPIRTGPIEATAMGNLKTQLKAL